MTRTVVSLAVLAFSVSALVGCSSRRLPPGTPPPEYEPPSVTPWPVESADAAAPTAPAPATSGAPESAQGAQLSQDAGVR